MRNHIVDRHPHISIQPFWNIETLNNDFIRNDALGTFAQCLSFRCRQPLSESMCSVPGYGIITLMFSLDQANPGLLSAAQSISIIKCRSTERNFSSCVSFPGPMHTFFVKIQGILLTLSIRLRTYCPLVRYLNN